MLKKIFFLSFFLFSFNSVFAESSCENPKISVYNVCDDINCFNTEKKQYLKTELSNISVLDNSSVQSIGNFKSWIDSELQKFIQDYDGDFTINNFCENVSNSTCNDKTFSLSELLNLKKEFKIDEEKLFVFWDDDYSYYEDGLGYFFIKYNDILSSLKKKNVSLGLQDIISNLLGYRFYNNKHLFRLKNVCHNPDCTTTKVKEINYDKIDEIKFLKGIIKSFNISSLDTFSFLDLDTGYANSSVKSGDSFPISFSFSENINNLSCEILKYEYKISYTYLLDNGMESEKTPYLLDVVKIQKNNGTLINIDNGGVVDLSIINNILTVNIKEGVRINKIGKIFVYVEISKNVLEKKEKKINNVAIDINPKSPDKNKSEIKLIGFKETQQYYPDNEFEVKAYLRDINRNSYSDTSGIDIKYGDFNKSDYVEFLSGVNYLTGGLVGVRSEIDSKNESYFPFKFKFNKFGNYKQQFYFKIKDKDVNGNIISQSFTNFVLKIVNNNSVDSKYKIRPIVKSEVLNIRCAQKVILRAVCEYDNYSGCDNINNNEIVADSESFNGETGVLHSVDRAGNRRDHPYIIDHVDRTPPVLEFINMDFPSIKASDQRVFKIKLSDSHPGGCRESSKVDYVVELRKNDSGILTKTGSIGKIGIGIKTLEINELNNIFEEIGDYNINITITDSVGNSNSYTKAFTTVPSNLSGSNSILSLVGINGNKYANNIDFYEYTLSLKDDYGNPIADKGIDLINQFCSSVTGCEELTTDETINSGSDALEEYGDFLTGSTNSGGIVSFKVKSISPGEFSERFKIQMNKWGDDYIDIDSSDIWTKHIGDVSKNSFKKPISGKFSPIKGGGELKIGTNQQYKITLTDNTDNGDLNSYNNGSLNISSGAIINNVNGHFWNKFIVINNLFGIGINNDLLFSGNIGADSNILKVPKIKTKKLAISYTLGGKNIKYYLDDFEINSSCEIKTLGLKVIGSLQGSGKGDITGQEKNFSDVSASAVRKQIRRNAYSLIRDRVSDSIVKGVKYILGDTIIPGDTTIPGEQDYETLIVKDGNVIINGNLNTSGKKLGIIVLKDNFKIKSDYNKKGNIYVNNNVNEINAIIYADGAFRSSNSKGVSYPDIALTKALNLTGSLFTNNTIGGAVRAGADRKYLLPSKETTNDYDLAEVYDLNYVRKVNSCEEDNYSFIIEYDPRVQINPPKGFSS